MRDANCTKCALCSTCQTKCIWGVGPQNAKIMFVGEAPGASEDMQGTPFVGQAGQKFTEMLNAAGINRDEVYISNICKCRPPNNREPTNGEIVACTSYLEEEIETVKPEIIVPMGNPALHYFLGLTGVTKHAGHEHYSDKYKCKIIPLLHPAYILRVPEHAGMTITHLQKIKTILMGQRNETPTNYVNATTMELVNVLFKRLREVNLFSLDIETSGFNFLKDKILCLGFSWQDRTAVTLPLLGYKCKEIWSKEDYAYIIRNLKEIMAGPAEKILQNGSFDIKFLKAKGIPIANFTWDTMLMHHLLDENLVGFHGLKPMAATYTDMGDYDAPLQKKRQELANEEKKRRQEQINTIKKDTMLSKDQKTQQIDTIRAVKIDIPFSWIPTDMLWSYQSMDADVTFRIKSILEKLLREEEETKLQIHAQHQHKSLLRLFKRIVMPQRNVLNEMEYHGALLDTKYMKELEVSYSDKLAKLEEEFAGLAVITQVEKMLYKLAADKVGERFDARKVKPKNMIREEYIEKYTKPVKFNPNSSDHLCLLLFDILKLKSSKKSEKTGKLSTDKEVLEVLAEDSPICDKLLRNRHLAKFYKTYVIGMGNQLDSTGRLHTNFNSHGTKTGRLSSSQPNLQNIPRGSDVKKMFIAPPGYKLVQFDFSQAEFRFWAQLSQDQKMITDIKNGMDIHKQTAADFWKIDITTVTKEQRNQAKFVVFGLMYGRGAKSVAAQVGITEAEAQGIIKYFFGKYPVAKRWLDTTHRFARKNHYVVNYFGRLRRLPMMQFQNDKNKSGFVAEALRQSVNAPIQSSAADVTGIGMIRIQDRLVKQPLDTRPTLTVHDSIIFECHEDQITEFAKLGYQELTRPIEGVTVPLDVEVQVGNNWLEMEEIDRTTLRA